MRDYLSVHSAPIIRLRVRRQFLFVRSGQSAARRNLVIQARHRRAGLHIGAGFTATKKIGGAVVRNRAKRRLRAAARLILGTYGQPGRDYVFIARKTTATTSWKHLLDDMESALISLTGSPSVKKHVTPT